MCRMSYANNKGADQPAHSRNVAHMFLCIYLIATDVSTSSLQM